MTKKIMVKVSGRNQISIPVLARQELNIHDGDRLLVNIQDGLIVLIPRPESFTDTMAGLNQEIWRDVDGQKSVSEDRGD